MHESCVISLIKKKKVNNTRDRCRIPSPKPSTCTPSKGLAKDAPPITTNNHQQHLFYIGLNDHVMETK